MKKHKYSSNQSGFFTSAKQWLLATPERSLELAYQAALNIEEIEKKYFNSQPIFRQNANYGEAVFLAYESDLKRNLSIIKLRLREFRNSRSFVEIYKQSKLGDRPFDGSIPVRVVSSEDNRISPPEFSLSQPSQSLILDKLSFIDEVTAKYTRKPVQPTASELSTTRTLGEAAPSYPLEVPQSGRLKGKKQPSPILEETIPNSPAEPKDIGSLAGQTSFLPRSILRTLDRLKRELDPKAEDEVVQEFRQSKTKTIVSIKFILLLILIPLLTQQVAKNFVVGPICDRLIGNRAEIFLNVDMKEEALRELTQFHEMLEFEELLATQLESLEGPEKEQLKFIGKIPEHLSKEDVEQQTKLKALEVAKRYTYRSSDAIKNIFSDLFSFVAFGLVIYKSEREIESLKSFIDDIVYGLSDSAKAFIIILFTDIFVGFHSPHGWEIVLEGISRHLGLPESRGFIYLFIATFPVILDTVFKYWIFRYLNRISPSAVATYRNMNE
ncbi:proton extrusion protein PcxA [Laspinema olomoucense]|uniref:Proton extrusion protein PxcA n=1 Tax=Laspinema olomoucense D3b TaxID=2953688 RepID=A0ABT2N530_9CYAN|nr:MULTISPECIES: proton extrusion protein PcxA [unclassified Laspinema]MCT7973099.1 proton extrusion protein PcxA [Laspinema sp. D3d]MCT7977799.1 proton extrusion protein PcxA [Laspinema sp. D3b]MCT7989787.1 proton extrusion protein PcxA [Laspinema sp. D3a]MCT7994188.1 proton extrusion protein PcxA [Laspinema sp. D3c]